MRISFSFLLTFFCLSCCAQDPEFSQFFSNPLYYNPAFAGVKIGPRFIFNFRDQWPSLNEAYVSYSASYDQFIDKIRSGIGFNVVGDNAGNGIYNSYTADAMYSYQIRVSENFNINMALEGGYFEKTLNWGEAVFADQLDPANPENIGTTSETPPLNTKVAGPDFGAGILAYSKKFYFGFSAQHLITPNEAFYTTDPTGTIPRRFMGNIGWETSSKNDLPHSFFFSPNLIYLYQQGASQLNAGAYFGVTPLYIGFYYRDDFKNPDAFILLVGVTEGIFRIGYSYDITLSGLAGYTGGAHEISLIINLADRTNATKEQRNAYKKYQNCPIIF